MRYYVIFICLFPLILFAQEPIAVTDISCERNITFYLSEQRQEIRLKDVIVPEKTLPQACRQLKKDWVHKNVLIQEISYDRHVHSSAVIAEYPEGKVVQLSLLQSGLAYVYIMQHSMVEERAEWYAKESLARESHIGIWKLSSFQMYDEVSLKAQLPDLKYKFVFARAVLRSTKTIGDMIYLNFSDQWQDDLTLGYQVLEDKARTVAYFEGFIGKNIQFRGWLEDYNGPFIRIYHPYHVFQQL